MLPGSLCSAAAMVLLLLLVSPSTGGAAEAPPSGALYWGQTFPDVATLSYEPIPLPGELPLRADTVSVGYQFACGMYNNGSAWCMGEAPLWLHVWGGWRWSGMGGFKYNLNGWWVGCTLPVGVAS